MAFEPSAFYSRTLLYIQQTLCGGDSSVITTRLSQLYASVDILCHEDGRVASLRHFYFVKKCLCLAMKVSSVLGISI